MIKTRLLVLLLAQALFLSVFPGNITKKYKTHLTEEGTVYFIMPQKMGKVKGCTAQKDLLFDITSLNTKDSVSLSATVTAEQPVTDSLATLTVADKTLVLPIEYLFRDLTKRGYVSRVRVSMTRSEFRQLFRAGTPFVIDFGKGYRFAFRQGEWAKEQQLVNSILDLMDLNP